MAHVLIFIRQSVDPSSMKQFSTKFSIPNSNVFLDINGDCIPGIATDFISRYRTNYDIGKAVYRQ